MDMDTACSSDGSMAASSSSHASHVGSTSGEETVTGTGSDSVSTCMYYYYVYYYYVYKYFHIL